MNALALDHALWNDIIWLWSLWHQTRRRKGWLRYDLYGLVPRFSVTAFHHEITRRERTQLSASFTTAVLPPNIAVCHSLRGTCVHLLAHLDGFGAALAMWKVFIYEELLWASRNRRFILKPATKCHYNWRRLAITTREDRRFDNNKKKKKTHRKTIMAGDDLSGALLASSITVISLTTVFIGTRLWIRSSLKTIGTDDCKAWAIRRIQQWQDWQFNRLDYSSMGNIS